MAGVRCSAWRSGRRRRSRSGFPLGACESDLFCLPAFTPHVPAGIYAPFAVAGLNWEANVSMFSVMTVLLIVSGELMDRLLLHGRHASPFRQSLEVE